MSSPPASPLPKSLPQPCNPPIHHFSTVTYPSTSVLNTSLTESPYNVLTYGRLGSPLCFRLQNSLTSLYSLYATLLTPSKLSSFTAITAAYLSSNSIIAVPSPLLPDLFPTIHSLLPRLGVRIITYTSAAHLHSLCESIQPNLLLIQSPIPPHFNSILTPTDIITLRSRLHSDLLVVLDDFGATCLRTEWKSWYESVDLVLLSADRSGGLLDTDASTWYGMLGCKHKRSWEKLVECARGKKGVCASVPAATECEKGWLALRTHKARWRVQRETLIKVHDRLKEEDVLDVNRIDGSLDLGVKVQDVEKFLDALQVVKIGDGTGGGAGVTYAWPGFAMFPKEKHINKWVTISIGLENPEDLMVDLLQALK